MAWLAQLIAHHVFYVGTGAIYRVFIEYFVFSKDFRTPALQQNWQSSEKSQNFKEKTQYLVNTLYYKIQRRFRIYIHLSDDIFFLRVMFW